MHSYYISGYTNPRDLAPDERDEPMKVVHLPCGFEEITVAVYGYGLSCSDCIEAAFEYLEKHGPDGWKNARETHGHYVYCTH